jgi:CBS domain-containing protein
MTLVQHILETARGRLAVLNREASICEAAAILANPNTPLVVVCDGEGVVVGVISRGDVVQVLATAGANAPCLCADEIMTKTVLSYPVDETLQRVWDGLHARSLRCAPILDAAGRPQGIVHARDVATALLDEVNNEELLLRDYVLGIGYQ